MDLEPDHLTNQIDRIDGIDGIDQTNQIDSWTQKSRYDSAEKPLSTRFVILSPVEWRLRLLHRAKNLVFSKT